MSGWNSPRHWLPTSLEPRPPVHRRADAGPTMAELHERYGARWDILAADSGALVAVPRQRPDGVTAMIVVSAWELAGFAAWLAEADQAMKEGT